MGFARRPRPASGPRDGFVEAFMQTADCVAI